MRLLCVSSSMAACFLLLGCIKVEWRGGMTPSLNWEKRGNGQPFLNPESGRLNSLLDGNSSIADWPGFRGPKRRGIAPQQGFPLDWRQEPKLIWRQQVGPGHSSLIMVGARLYTMEQEGDFETLSCRSMRDGTVIWKHQIQNKWSDSMGGVGPRSTPVASKGKIYALVSNGTLVCLQASTGKVIWERAILEPDYEFPHWGLAPSPLVLSDLVIVSPGGQLGAIKAYDASTGKTKWVSELKGNGVYLSPMALELKGETHLVAAVEGMLAGLDPATGKTRWEHPWKIFMINAHIAQPLELSEDTFLLSAGYGKGAEARGLKKTQEGFITEMVWKSKNLKTKFSSPVRRDNYIYGFNESSLTCLDAHTGALMWRGKKYGYGRILLAEDKLLILGNTGTFSVVEAQPDSFSEVSSHQLLSKERCWNGPVLVGGYLVVRNGSEICCYDYKAP